MEKMRAEELDERLDEGRDERLDVGEDVTSFLDLQAARRPGLEQRRVSVDFPCQR